ncbi:MAG: hypothetical protein R3B06_27995 [Kofleriaceae bacterium]
MIKLALALVVAAAGLLAHPGSAAAKVPVIYQTGQEGFECGPLPDEWKDEPAIAGFKAGYVCDIKGVFWSYFSVSNCKPAAIKGNQYNDAPELAAAIKAKYPESSMKRGIWNRYGWMLLALLVLAGVAIWVKELITGKSDDDDDAPAAAPPAP